MQWLTVGGVSYLAGDKNIFRIAVVLQDECVQFSLILQTHALSFKSVCNKEHNGEICNMAFLSNSSQSTRPTGQVLWEDLLVFSRFHW